MQRFLLGLLLLAPVTAAAGVNLFTAEFAAAPARAQFVASDMGWNCAGALCRAQGGMSDTPARLCAKLAKETGLVSRFSVNGAPLEEAALARCNARAKALPQPELARAQP